MAILSKQPLLNDEECRHICQTLFSMQNLWENRGYGYAPFYSLGAASYLDMEDNEANYREKAQRLNPLLKENFAPLYAKLADHLSQQMGMPVSYFDQFALPGFHIFLASKLFQQAVASTHFDLQFESLNWPFDKIDFANPISYTVTLALPHSGAGLYYWEIYYDQTKDLSKAEIEKLRKVQETKYLQYQLGELVLHRGLILHQIAPSKEIVAEDKRITLQGHGLICDGTVQLYW